MKKLVSLTLVMLMVLILTSKRRCTKICLISIASIKKKSV